MTLLEGPALAAGAGVAAALLPGLSARHRAALGIAAAGAAACGGYDDVAGSWEHRGFRGHLGALARGQVTSGSIKMFGIGATSLAAGGLVSDSVPDAVSSGALIAASANLVNLFDLRPGRAIKVGVLAGTPGLAAGGSAGLLAAVPLGAGAALLPEDLGERAMLGDAGANALGALLGVAAAAELGRGTRLALLGGLITATAASEVVSFSRVIDAVGPLHWVDQLGRRPSPAR